jgi:hypothetical protein
MLADELFDSGEGKHYWILPFDPYRSLQQHISVFP